MKVSEVDGSQPTNQVESEVKQTKNTAKKEGINLQAEKKEEAKEQKSEKKLTKEQVKEGLEKLNETVQTFHEDLQFELHEDSNRMMTKLVKTDNNEVLKEIPPEEMLDMIGRIKNMVGLILDEKI
ncbi:flagellar protein FlaG [Halanaerobaculum tunisiense]